LQRTTVTVTEGFDTADLKEAKALLDETLLKMAAPGYTALFEITADDGRFPGASRPSGANVGP
jgi:hypothetical protein